MITNYFVTKEIWDDSICRATIILTGCAYVSWFFFLMFVYPLQWEPNGHIASIALCASLGMMIVIIFYLSRIYNMRVSHIKLMKSRKKFREEMKAIYEEEKRLESSIQELENFDILKEVENVSCTRI